MPMFLVIYVTTYHDSNHATSCKSMHHKQTADSVPTKQTTDCGWQRCPKSHNCNYGAEQTANHITMQ